MLYWSFRFQPNKGRCTAHGFQLTYQFLPKSFQLHLQQSDNSNSPQLTWSRKISFTFFKTSAVKQKRFWLAKKTNKTILHYDSSISAFVFLSGTLRFFELHKLTERNYNFESEDHKSLRQSWRIDDEEKSILGKKRFHNAVKRFRIGN